MLSDLKETPLVSVIIPTHNRPLLLEEAIKSLIEQSYPNWEAIIVDNGSKNTVEYVVDNFSDSRLRYYYRFEGNRSKARNFGVSKAKGEYIAFLDDDDRFMPDKLLEQVKYLNTHPDVGLVSCGAVIINEKGEKVINWTLWEDHEELTLKYVLPGCGMMPSSVMMRKIWYEHVGGFDPNLHLAEDYDFHISLLVEGCKMAFVHYYLLEYRVHPGDSKKYPIRYGYNYEAILGRIFANPRMPDEIKKEENWIRARFALLTLANSFLDAEKPLKGYLYPGGSKFYDIAKMYIPDLDRQQHLVVEAIVGAARRNEYDDPFVIGERALLEAGRRFNMPRKMVMKARARLAQESFVRAYKRGDYKEAHRYFRKAFWLRPTWLRHRAVWGIYKNVLLKIRAT